jgi:cytochrome c peroxidase
LLRFFSFALTGLAIACASRTELRGAQGFFRLPMLSGLDVLAPVPDSNPLTRSKIALGERLFNERSLSLDKSVSCASCHLPAHGFSDSVAFSRGVAGRRGARNAPALINRVYGRTFFWDGRAVSLEQQVLHPIADTMEMGLPLHEMTRRLRSEPSYRRLFREAFGIDADTTAVARALASYVRTLRSGESPLDRWRDGDTAALSLAARRGFALFTGKAKCSACHVGPNFTDELFHNTGVATRSSRRLDGKPADAGRAGVTHDFKDSGAFKTPTLREVARTAPYMHDGSFPTLDEVIDFYDGAGFQNDHLDPEIHPLGLSASERSDLVGFLRSLNGSMPVTARIKRPESYAGIAR